ncbi:hypothetical protein Leryth_024454 [Lithospermum erythrorhizon]|nr:hypothetical protein Leryth_024454 [Lithospermum erythrorhizon]
MSQVFNLHHPQPPPRHHISPPPPPRQHNNNNRDERSSFVFAPDDSSDSDSDSGSGSVYSNPIQDPFFFFGDEDNPSYVTDLFDHEDEDDLIDPFSQIGNNSNREEDDDDNIINSFGQFGDFNCEDDGDDDVIDSFAEFYDSNRKEDDHNVIDSFGQLGENSDNVIDSFEFGELNSGEEEMGLGLGLRLGREFEAIDGLRVVDSDSDTDMGSGDLEVDFGIENGFSEGNEYGVDDHDWPVMFDCLRFDEPRVVNEEFEWEEVNERDERDNLGSLIDRIEEISVNSGFSSENGDLVDGEGEDVVERTRNLEWEVLLAVNNFDRSMEFDGEGTDGNDGVTYLAVQDDYMYTVEYDTLFGQFVDSEGALKGSPPAAKSVVENLPSIVLKTDDVKEVNVVCAVCKDDIAVGEEVNKLPCSHYYHGDCIVPWLTIRNSCPVCRYELPTDDADYERRKNERSIVAGVGNDLQVRYNFETLP